MGIETSNNQSQDPQQGDHKQDTAMPLRKTANIPDVVYSRCGKATLHLTMLLTSFNSNQNMNQENLNIQRGYM